MVSILPSERTPFDVIGKDVGRALQSVLPGAVQQGFQRGQGLSAIDQLQEALGAAGGDINKILPALAKAYTMNPNLERSGLGQQYLQQARANTSVNPVTSAIGGIGQAPGMAVNAAQQSGQGTQHPQQTQQQSPISQGPPAQPGQGIFLSNFIPQDIGELISPEQKAKMISDVAQKGGDINLTRQLIDDYNQGKIGVNDLANSNVEKQAANVQRQLGFENQIKERIDKQLPKETSEAEKNIYYNMVRRALEGTSSFTDAWQKVAGDIDNFRKLNESYVNRIPDSDFRGVSDSAQKKLRESANPILEQDPLAYNVLEAAYTKKGHSPITPAKILKPLSQPIKAAISKAGDYREMIFPMDFSTSEFPERAMQRNIDMAQEGQQKDIPKVASSLRSNWDDDISLLNIYADLKSKGWLLSNITSIFDDIQDKFSPRQQAERAMLNQDLRVPTKYLGIPWGE